jgi:cytochrome P450
MSNLVDFVPILQHLPSPLRTRGRNLHRDLVDTYGGLISDIDRRMRGGEKIPDCLAKTMLEARKTEQLDDLDMCMIASAFMIGGVETVGHTHTHHALQ